MTDVPQTGNSRRLGFEYRLPEGRSMPTDEQMNAIGQQRINEAMENFAMEVCNEIIRRGPKAVQFVAKCPAIELNSRSILGYVYTVLDEVMLRVCHKDFEKVRPMDLTQLVYAHRQIKNLFDECTRHGTCEREVLVQAVQNAAETTKPFVARTNHGTQG